MDLLTVLLLLWFGSYAYLYIFKFGGPKPLYSYFLLFNIVLIYGLYRSAISNRPFIPAADLGLGAFFAWLASYFIYGSFEFLRSTQDAIAIQTFITLSEMVLFAGAFMVLLVESRRLEIAAAIFATLAVVGTAINLWDFFVPTFSSVPGRAAGLYDNPNISGLFIALAMVAGITRVPYWVRWPYLLICGLGVIVTFSRESWIIWGFAVIGLAWAGYLSKARQRVQVLIFAAILGGGVTLSLFTGHLGNQVADSNLSTYLTPNTATRLGIGTSTISDHSADLRKKLIFDSLELASHYPWLGYGLGYTYEWRLPVAPHNMYLLFLVEGGILGLSIYLSLMALLWWTTFWIGRILALQIVVSSLFSHNILDQPTTLLIIVFIIACGVVERRQKRRNVETSENPISVTPTKAVVL